VEEVAVLMALLPLGNEIPVRVGEVRMAGDAKANSSVEDRRFVGQLMALVGPLSTGSAQFPMSLGEHERRPAGGADPSECIIARHPSGCHQELFRIERRLLGNSRQSSAPLLNAVNTSSFCCPLVNLARLSRGRG